MRESGIDPFLGLLVATVESMSDDSQTPRTIELTLQVGGIVVMGELISQQAFLDASTGVLGPVAEHEEQFLQEVSIRDGTSVEQARIEYGCSFSDGTPKFLHLRGVQFWLPGSDPAPSQSTDLWRGRLDRVDAFCLGDSL